jgi:hypothetical protein
MQCALTVLIREVVNAWFTVKITATARFILRYDRYKQTNTMRISELRTTRSSLCCFIPLLLPSLPFCADQRPSRNNRTVLNSYDRVMLHGKIALLGKCEVVRLRSWYRYGRTTWRVSGSYRSRCKSWLRLAENIYLTFQFWTAVHVVQSRPECESRERSVCVLRFRFINKEYYISIRVVHFLRADAFWMTSRIAMTFLELWRHSHTNYLSICIRCSRIYTSGDSPYDCEEFFKQVC